MKIPAFVFTFFSIVIFSQQQYSILTIDKYDSAYPNENERFFWIINESNKNPNASPLYFFTVSEEMKSLCNKNSSIGVFNRLENTLPEQKLDSIFDKIYANKKLLYSVKKKFINGKRKIRYNIFATQIKTEKLFSCHIDGDDGKKINYQGEIFFLDKNFIINDKIDNNLNKYESAYLLNLNYIKTNPYEVIRFK